MSNQDFNRDKHSMAGAQVRVLVQGFEEVLAESEREQQLNKDCLETGFKAVYPRVFHADMVQNDPTELIRIWEQWEPRVQQLFFNKYGDIAQLLSVRIDENLVRAGLEFWDPSYRCFSFSNNDLTPTLEEVSAMLRIETKNDSKIYISGSKKGSFQKKLTLAFGKEISNLLSFTATKAVREHIPVETILNLFRRKLEENRAVDLLAFAIYGLFIFPRALHRIDEAVLDFFISMPLNPVPTILAEIIRSLDYLRVRGKGRFTGCLSILYVWIHSHVIMRKSTYIRYSDTIPIAKFNNEFTPVSISRQQWVDHLGVMKREEINWYAPWMSHELILYRCGNKPWVSLPGIWGITRYAPLLVLRQFAVMQFIPMTHDLQVTDSFYTDDISAVTELAAEWKTRLFLQTRGRTLQTTPHYEAWRAYSVRNVACPRIGENPKLIILETRAATEKEMAKRRLALERSEADDQKIWMSEKVMNLELELRGKELRIEELEKQIANAATVTDELNRNDRKMKRKVGESGKYVNPELEEAMAEKRRLEEEIRSLLKDQRNTKKSWMQEKEEMVQKAESQEAEIQKLRRRVSELRTADNSMIEESERHRELVEREVVQACKLRSRNQVLTARILNLEETIKEGTESLKLAEDRILELTGSVEQAENQTSDITELLGKAESDIQELEEQVEGLTNVVNELEQNVNVAEDGWDQAIATRDEALLERNEALEVCDRALAARNRAIQRSTELEGIAERRLQWFNAHFHRYQRDAWKAERTLERIKNLLGRIGLGTRGYNALLAMVHEVQVQYEHFVTPWRKIRAQAPDWPVAYDAYGGGIPERYEAFVDEDVEEITG